MLKNYRHIINLTFLLTIALLCMALTGCAHTNDEDSGRIADISAELYNNDIIAVQPFSDDTEKFRRHLGTLPIDSVFQLGTGYILKEPTKVDSSMMCLMTVVQRRSDSLKDKKAMETIAKAYVNMAYVYSNVYSNLGNSFSNLRKAEKICLTYGFDEVLSYVYLNLGVTVSKEDIFNGREADPSEDTAYTAYLRKAFEIAERHGDTTTMSYCIYNMTATENIPPNDSVASYIKRYLNHTTESNDFPEAAYFRALCRGVLNLSEGNTGLAHEEFQKTQNYNIDIEPLIPRMQEHTRELNALTYEIEGRNDKAEQILLDIAHSAVERDDLESFMEQQMHLSMLYSRIGRHEDADKCQLNYYRTRDALMERNRKVTLEQLRLKENLDEFQNRLDEALQQERQMRSWLLTGGVAGIAVILILLLTLIYSRRRRRYITALYERHISTDPTPVPESISPTPATPSLAAQDIEAEPKDDIQSPPETSTVKTAEAPSSELMERIEKVLSESQEIFNPDFQMTTLCAMVGSNITYVSRAVNTYYGKPFKIVLAERRIREACRRLDIPADNASLTIEAICHDVGFRSRTAFSAAFKNITGLTPTEYRKAAARHHRKDN